MKVRKIVILTQFILIPFSLFMLTFKQHYVKEGENLFQISKRYNVPLNEILKVNDLDEKAVIKKGAMIKIPIEKDPESSTTTGVHVVAEGENLFRIGLKYNITVDKLCKLNNFSENVKLFKGMKIKVPTIQEKSNEILSSSQPVIKPQNSKNNDYFFHTMEKGETLYRISKLYQIDLEQLLGFNQINDSTILKPGTQIKIPEKKKQDHIPVKPPERKEAGYPKGSKNHLEYPLPLNGKVIPYVKSHYRGILIFSETDQQVKAIDKGVVSHIETTPSFGLIVFIRHPNGLVSTYSGFQVIYVEKEMEVKQGDLIGLAGTITKNSNPGILYSLQEGDKALRFDMNRLCFYR